ncbi:MAG: hypothetical protein GXP24_08675 [Planctomycetes bacterium]|nr:hypothetical protein [Planctomycetota bacterium]
MKRWIRKRHDQRHSTLSPSSRRCRARRLAFERCEDRRMLSGNSPVAHVSLALSAGEGGFITVSANSFLQTNANNFLFDAGSLNQTIGDFTLLDIGQTVSFGEPLVTSGAASDFDLDSSAPVFTVNRTNDLGIDSPFPAFLGNETSGNEANSSIAPTFGPTIGPSLYDLDLTDVQAQEPLLPTTGNSDALDDKNTLAEDHTNAQTDGPPGLQGKTTQLLVIEDPIQIVSSPLNTDRSGQREGGALEVATAVHNTQQAYETQLSAVIAHNLDRNAVLPTTVATPARPVVAEIARAVAFETLGQQRVISTGEIDRVKVQPLRESTEVTSPRLNPVAAQLRTTPADSTAAVNATIDATTQSSRALRSAKGTAANLVERIENEQQSAQIANFAQWPTLATVIASFLLIETRRSHVAPPTEQLPLRRERRRKR